tara:strand:+ start:131 stop:400 length:270 start_codon:yes stop_codon:yes gene_type:complete
MNFTALVFHSLAIISVFKGMVVIRSIVFFLVYLFFIFNNISTFTLIPVLFLIVFTLTILKISMRTNINELNKSLENVDSIDVLRSPNNR